MKTRVIAPITAALTALVSSSAFAVAVPIDLANVTLQFAELDTAIVAIGGLLLAAAALAVGYKWVKGMLFS